MKKFLLIILIACASIVNAEQVDLSVAQQVANNFINAPSIDTNGIRRAPKKLKQMARTPKQIIDNQQFYIFNSEDGEGFVIVAADDRVHPILGYSHTSSFDCNNVPNGLSYWLGEYSRQINYAIENNISPSADVIVKWEQLKTQAFVAATEIVSPLITTQWDQAPFYNEKCPYNYIVFERTVTGCAATALAQVMNYWQWPLVGDGYHSYSCKFYGTQSANFGGTYYDWNNMPNQLSSSSSTTQINAVATLMYHCGVALDMDYGLSKKYWNFNNGSGSSAGKDAFVNAAINYFRYSSTTKNAEKENYTDAEWISLIKGQLDKKQPMVYWGIGDGGGHAFVCDGYDSQNYFHFNWGWSGNCDAYYPITALIPGEGGIGSGSSGDYTAIQGAIIDMLPRTANSNVANLQLNSNWYVSADSIRYGGTLASSVSVKNYGTTSFTGDIIAMVLDKDGNYFADYVIEENCTIAKNGTKTFNPYVSSNAGLVPGKYYVSLFCKSNDLGYQIVGSEYYTNLTSFKVYHKADIETYSDFTIYSDDSNQLVTGKTSRISLNVKNTGSKNFSGSVALVLYTTDLSSGQDYDEISLSLTGIGAGATRTLTFSGTINLAPGTYILALAFSDNNGNVNFAGSTYYANPIYVIVRSSEEEEMPDESDGLQFKPGKYVIVANREEDSKNNWYYMTSDLGTASTKRFQAVSAGKENIDAIATSNLDAQYIWDLEADGTNWKLKNGNQYITWKSGNSANLDAVGKSLTFDIIENQVIAHFNDGSAERYLSLHTGNNYFAFYGNTGQIEQLYFLPYEDKTTPPTPELECKSVPYTETFASSQGDFTVYNALLPSGFSSIWNWDSRYGMVAKCIKGSTKYTSEAYLISPCIELPETSKCVLTFSHAAKFFQDTKQMSLWISTNYDETNPESADWDRLVIPTYPTGDNWNWFESGAIDLSEYSGQNVNIAFCYTSTESYAPQWEIKNFVVKKATTTELESIGVKKSTSTKILRDGQLFIVRDGKTYNVMGQEL